MPKRGNGSQARKPPHTPRTTQGKRGVGRRVSQVAAELGTSTDYIYSLIRSGQLRALRLPGAGRRAAAWTVLPEDFDQFVARCRSDA